MRAKRAVFAVVPLLALIFIAEICCRLAASLFLISRTPQINSNESLIIGCYGDSWTYGLGVSPDSAYPSALERAFRIAGHPNIAVSNRGIPGAGIAQTAKRAIEDLTSANPPRLALILVGMNDMPHMNRIAKKESAPFLISRLFNRSAAYRAFKALASETRRRYAPGADFPSVSMPSDVFEDQLVSLAKRVGEYGSIPVVLSYSLPVNPIRPQLLIKDDLPWLDVAQRRAAARADVSFIDLQPAMDAVPGDEPWLDVFYTHPNELGYAIIAARIFPYICRALGISCSRVIDPKILMRAKTDRPPQWPEEALFSQIRVRYKTTVEKDGSKTIRADADGDGEVDYNAHFRDGLMLSLTRINKSDGKYFTNEYRNGALIRVTGKNLRGQVMEQIEIDNSEWSYKEIRWVDKNLDGRFDHYEELHNGVLIRHEDDNNQDGIFEIKAVIDESGTDIMHVGDMNNDGETDYWELRDGPKILFISHDNDRDGRPDKQLPPPSALGLKTIHPLAIDRWK